MNCLPGITSINSLSFFISSIILSILFFISFPSLIFSTSLGSIFLMASSKVLEALMNKIIYLYIYI